MRRASTLAWLFAVIAPVASAQHAGHGMDPMPGMSAAGHARMAQPQPSSPPLPSPTAEELAHAFPDLGGMEMRDHMDDDPLVATLAFDRLEIFRDDGANGLAWELHGWAGHRRDRFEWRSRGQRIAGDTRDGELELLWSRATSAWWNRTLGVRHDFGGGTARDWLALGVEGIAPYKIDVMATLYAGEDGVGARLETSYDLLLTQRLVLQPRLEATGYAGRDAPDSGFEAGMRLRYELSRQFAPYAGYQWSSGEEGGEWVAGVRAWF